MNSPTKTTSILITSLLAFALLANVNVGSVFATGGLDDEEEEEAIEQLQNDINELKDTLGTIELNLTEGPNDIQANCPSTEEIVQEVVENITAAPENNITEPEQPTCPFVEPVQNVTEPEPQPIVPPQQNNLTCPFAPQEPEPAAPQENTTEVIEEIIENVTTGQPVCNIPIPEIIPEIVLPPVEENVTEPQTEQPICNLTGQPLQEQQNSILEPESELTQGEPFQQQLQDEQEVATIEFEASCGCFVVDKSPEEVQ